MSGGLNVLALREDDVFKFLACQTHVGSVNSDFQMRRYIYGRRPDGVNIINLRYTWEKLLLAARAIAAIENPADICVVSARPYAQRAVLKFAAHTGSTPVVGRFTPGCFTNQIQKQFKEPRLLIVSDSRVDHQAISEASHVCLPVIAFCNTDSPLRFVDVTIPCNNKGAHSIGLLWWMLAREVLYMKGKMTRQTGFILEGKEIMPDLYFYRDPEEQEKEEVAETVEKEAWNVAPQVEPRMEEFQAIVADSTQGKLGLPSVPLVEDWAQETAKWDPKPEAASGAQEWGASFQSSW